MRAPLSWLREHVDVPADHTGRDVAERLIRAGLEVEAVDVLGAGVSGPLVVGRVQAIEEFTASNGKSIRYVRVDVGEHNGPTGSRGVICGALNFAVGDTVVVALPGSILPGGFAIGARKTYGHLSDGMICSARELDIGDDHAGILVLGSGRRAGDDLLGELVLRDDVLDIAVTPDRGYCMSIRGIARELSIAYGVAFRDPAGRAVELPGGGLEVVPTDGCDRFVALSLSGLDPAAPTPLWMRSRLARCGVRPITLAVDVTNYVQLELGQPLHAYDARSLVGALHVRFAAPGERLETLDGVPRSLLADDLVIADDAGGRAGRAVGLAGVMGGASTEIGPTTTEVVLEAAHFDPVAVSRTGRRLGLTSEAAKRFERGVDPTVSPVAATRAAELLVEHGGARVTGATDAGEPVLPGSVRMAVNHPDRVAGVTYGPRVVHRRLQDVGCEVSLVPKSGVPDEWWEAAGQFDVDVQPPPWRPDLEEPNDLAEEVIRLEGYETLPSVLPRVPPGRGLTPRQRLRRRVGRALAAAGYVEVLPSPFVGSDVLDGLGIGRDDERRRLVRLANPMSDEEPYLRPVLLADLVTALRRNVGRGNVDVALFELGTVFRDRRATSRGAGYVVARPSVQARPSGEELEQLDAMLPAQPEHVAVLLAGSRTPGGWWGPGLATCWADAVEAARVVAAAAGVEVTVRAAELAPWHPGRCAAIECDGIVVGWAGELHPRVLAALELPARTAAMELDLDALAPESDEPVRVSTVSPYPVAKEDIALVVDAAVPASTVAAAVRAGAGDLLEDLRLFDVYTGDQVGAGRKSLAFHLRLRAPDRTLTAQEVAAATGSAVTAAADRTGATLRT